MSDPKRPLGDTPGVMVWDNQTNAPSYIRLEDYQEAVASGRYRPYEGTVVRTERLGAQVQSSPESGLAHTGAGERFVDPSVQAAADARERRRQLHDNLADKAFTVAEGFVDAVTLGLVHERGESADIRRDVNSGSAFLGQALGMIGSTVAAPGTLLSKLPAGRVARGGEVAGRAIGEAAFGVATKGEAGVRAVARRATKEAVENSAVGTAAAFGHGASDALIEDKPFAAEAVVAAAWQDALIGGGFGAAGQLFSRARSTIRAREAIGKQAGVLDVSSPASASVNQAARDAVDAWGSQLEKHRVAHGVLDVAARNGELGPSGAEWVAGRKEALKAAERARSRLEKWDLAKVLEGDDPKAVNRALEALDDYSSAMARLDESMRPGEWTVHQMRPRAQVTPGQASPPPVTNAAGEVFSPVLLQMDELMTPDLRARYRQIYGEDYRTGESVMDEVISRQGPDAPAPEMVPTPSSLEQSAVASPRARRARAAQEADTPPVAQQVDESPTLVDGPRDLQAPDLMGPHPKSSLEAFAYDVESTAARLGSGRLEDVLSSMGRPGRAPMTLERFRELVGEAEQAGYLVTRGDGAEVPYLGTKVGDEIVVRGEPPADWKPDKRARFGRWGDQGNLKKAPDTIVEGAQPADPLAAQLGAGAADPLSGKTYKEAQPFGKARRGKAAEPDPMDRTYREEMSFDEPAPVPEAPVSAADPVDTSPTVIDRSRGVRPGSALDNYIAQMGAPGPRLDPGDMSARKVNEALEALAEATDGRVGSAEAREAAEAAGLSLGARGPLAEHLGAIWGLRQLGRASADAAKGGKHSPLMAKMIKRAGIAGGRQIAMGGKMGPAMLGAMGGAMGGHLIGAALGMAGGLASSVGRARDAVVKAGAALLAGRGSRAAARIPMSARYAYDGSDPTEDVVERVQQLQNVLADPEGARAQIRESLGDLAIIQPGLADAAVDRRLAQYQNLAIRAPMFVWNALGEARPAGAQALRRFREYEDATWNLEGLLRDVSAGALTKTRAEALREQYPEVAAVLARQVMQDPAALRRLDRNRLAQVEMITGFPLTTRTPDYAARTQAAFHLPQQPAPQAGTAGLKPPAPTPAQAPYAPGNH